MNKINSRSKGSRFERSIAKWFQTWTNYEFGRVPGSGSLRWKKTDNISGDIVCTDPKHSRRFPFNIECKSYKDIKFEHVLLGLKSCKINSFWDQCKSDAKRANKVPLLIMKYNSMPKGQFFFIVNKQTGEAIVKLGHKDIKMLTIKTSEKEHLYVFLATDIKKLEYIDIYKIGRNFTKKH